MINKKFKFWASIVCSILPGLAFAQTDDFTITGKVSSLPNTAKVYLYYQTVSGVNADSAQILNGSFNFKGKISQPVSTYLIVNPKGTGYLQRNLQKITFYLEPGKIVVSSKDSILNAKISGGKINSDNENLKQILKPVQDKMNEVMAEYNSATPDKRSSKEFNSTLQKRYSTLSEEQNGIYKNFILSHPKSVLSIFLIKQVSGATPNVVEVEKLYNSLAAEVKSSSTGKSYLEELNKLKSVAIGAIAPEFTMTDTIGKPVALKDFRGKYVLVDFWASWCGPCRAENPNVVKAYNKYQSKGFTILGVSLDQPNAKEKWLKAIHDDGLTWTHVSDLKGWKNEVAQLYSVKAIPQNFLVDPNGKIVATNVRGDELEKTLNSFLGN